MKPSEVTLFRPVEEGGLGLQNIKCKALASLISSFLQTAKDPRFLTSLYHLWLYQYHVEDAISLPDPGFPPYYNRDFFNIIKTVKREIREDIVFLTQKEWYYHLLRFFVTERDIPNYDMKEKIPCRMEKEPEINWPDIYANSRLKGLSPDDKSFMIKTIHQLLPVKLRVSILIPNSDPSC